MVTIEPHIYFQNPAGRLLEHPTGHYLIVKYATGPRRLADLQTLLGHAKQLLARRGWHKLLGDQRRMVPFTAEEVDWLTDFWLNMAPQRVAAMYGAPALYGAVLISSEVYTRLPACRVQDQAQTAALTYRLFKDEDEADAWLAQLPQYSPRELQRI